jgi:two-component system sensor histidine kinase KdpD
MDLDAILAPRPALVLVDELAHTNAPGSRHPKRYQDVEELLAAGIDVFSTVNIQHIESLNDVVASFTKVRVRETVPDRVLENAEIEIVDIPPDELIERLKDGKVYVPEEATRALGHFFSKSNLSALRELALRRAAQAVDAQMLDYLHAHALAGTWAAASGWWSRSASCPARPNWSAPPSASPMPCARPGPRCISRRRAPQH